MPRMLHVKDSTSENADAENVWAQGKDSASCGHGPHARENQARTPDIHTHEKLGAQTIFL